MHKLFVEVTSSLTGKRIAVAIDEITATEEHASKGCVLIMRNGFQVFVSQNYDDMVARILKAEKL